MHETVSEVNSFGEASPHQCFVRRAAFPVQLEIPKAEGISPGTWLLADKGE